MRRGERLRENRGMRSEQTRGEAHAAEHAAHFLPDLVVLSSYRPSLNTPPSPCPEASRRRPATSGSIFTPMTFFLPSILTEHHASAGRGLHTNQRRSPPASCACICSACFIMACMFPGNFIRASFAVSLTILSDFEPCAPGRPERSRRNLWTSGCNNARAAASSSFGGVAWAAGNSAYCRLPNIHRDLQRPSHNVLPLPFEAPWGPSQA